MKDEIENYDGGSSGDDNEGSENINHIDFFVFDVDKAPKSMKEFINWYKLVTTWGDELNTDISIATYPLQSFYNELIETYEPMSLATDDDYDDIRKLERFAVYTITNESVFISVAPTQANRAHKVIMKASQRHGVGFVNVSIDDPLIVLPNFKVIAPEDATEDAIKYVETMIEIDYNTYNDLYQKNIDLIMAMPESERDPDMVQSLACDLNNTERFQEAIDTLMLIKDTTTDKAHWLYVLGYAYHGLGKYDEAIKYIEETRALTEEYNHCMDTLADSYHHIGDNEKATTIIKETIDNLYEYIEDSDNDEGYYEIVTRLTSDSENKTPYPFLNDEMLSELANACYKTATFKLTVGERTKAKELVDMALKIKPDSSDYKSLSELCNKAVN